MSKGRIATGTVNGVTVVFEDRSFASIAPRVALRVASSIFWGSACINDDSNVICGSADFDAHIGRVLLLRIRQTVSCYTFSWATKINSNEYVVNVARSKAYLASGQSSLAGIVLRHETTEH